MPQALPASAQRLVVLDLFRDLSGVSNLNAKEWTPLEPHLGGVAPVQRFAAGVRSLPPTICTMILKAAASLAEA
jgi:hypothetical protein